MARLSVILCNYNHAKFVGRAIDAIISQSRQPDQFVIIDDGSTDNSVEVIRACVKDVPYVEFVALPDNTKVFGALSQAMGIADGDYLYAAASDDYILPGFFEKAMAMAEQYPTAGAVCGMITYLDEGSGRTFSNGVRKWQAPLYADPGCFLREWLEAEHPFHALSGGTIYRREALLEVGGFRTELLFYCDFFAFRAIGLKHGVCYFPDAAQVMRMSHDTFSFRQMEDLKTNLALVARMAGLMRSSQFRKVFPPDHVERWSRDLRCLWVDRRIALLGAKYHEAGKDALNIAELGSVWALGVSLFLMKAIGVFRKLLLFWLRLIASGYKGIVG